MDIRVCPHCADELTQAVSGGFLHLYCQGCGYEAKEVSDEPRHVVQDDRHKMFDAKIVSIKSGKKKQDRKAKAVRDQVDRVPRRGSR